MLGILGRSPLRPTQTESEPRETPPAKPEQSGEEAARSGKKGRPAQLPVSPVPLLLVILSLAFYHEGSQGTMTKEELSYHVELCKQLAADLELLATLEARTGPRAQHLDGMPHAPGVRDVVGDLAAELADLKTEINELEAEIAHSEAAIADYISSIKDARTRMIFRLRFIRGMAWKEVAATIGWISVSGTKAIYDRYIARGGPARMGRPPKR